MSGPTAMELLVRLPWLDTFTTAELARGPGESRVSDEVIFRTRAALDHLHAQGLVVRVAHGRFEMTARGRSEALRHRVRRQNALDKATLDLIFRLSRAHWSGQRPKGTPRSKVYTTQSRSAA